MLRVKRIRRIAQTACLLTAMLGMDSARCGAPFQTDDPNIVPLRHAEVLPYYQSTLTHFGRVGALFGVELHYGALERTEVDVALPWVFNTPAGGTTARGYGDTVVGVKYALHPEADGFLLSAVPRISFPTGNASRALGNGGSAIFLALSAQKIIDSFTSYGTAGYWINNGEDNRNYGFVGWEAQYKFSDRWTLGGEIFYNGPPGSGQRSSVGFNVGGFFAVEPKIQILFSMGRGVVNAAERNRVSTYLGALFAF